MSANSLKLVNMLAMAWIGVTAYAGFRYLGTTAGTGTLFGLLITLIVIGGIVFIRRSVCSHGMFSGTEPAAKKAIF